VYPHIKIEIYFDFTADLSESEYQHKLEREERVGETESRVNEQVKGKGERIHCALQQ
jgi:hypothetical protein